MTTRHTRPLDILESIRDLVNVVARILSEIFKTQESAIAVIIVMNRQLFCAKVTTHCTCDSGGLADTSSNTGSHIPCGKC